MNSIFWGVLLALGMASLVGCREENALHRSRQASLQALAPPDERYVSRLVLFGKPLADDGLLPAALDLAENIADRPCRWTRYLGWVWIVGFALGAGIAVAFGTAREIATRFLFLDVVLLIGASTGVA